MPDAEQLFFDRIFTDWTLQELADREGMTAQGIDSAVKRFTRRHIDQIELNLMIAYKEDALLALIVPEQAAESQALALRYVDHVVRELEKRDFPVEVHYRATEDGSVAFFLEWRPRSQEVDA